MMMSIVTSELEEDDECNLLSSFTYVNKNIKKDDDKQSNCSLPLFLLEKN